MTRFPQLSALIFTLCVRAWADAWVAMWEGIADALDPDYQRDLKSQDRNQNVADLDQGGNFYAAGCGSDGD